MEEEINMKTILHVYAVKHQKFMFLPFQISLQMWLEVQGGMLAVNMGRRQDICVLGNDRKYLPELSAFSKTWEKSN